MDRQIPHRRARSKSPRSPQPVRRRSVLSGTATLLVGALSGCIGGTGNGPVDDLPEEDERVRIIEHQLVREEEGTEEETVVVRGVAEVIDEEDEVDYVEIRARFYDEEGELLDSTVENVEDVTQETSWEFEIVFPHFGEDAAKVSDYDVTVVTTI